MRFSAPLFLLLLLALPYLAWPGWPARGPGRRREALALALRLLIALGLILGLAGLEIARPGDELAVVFLVDVSDSMPAAAKGAAIEFVRAALESMPADDRAALVLFGADAVVERPASSARRLGPITSAPASGGTDLAGAIRLGLALFPPGAARRMVILSDGAATAGDAGEAARLARAASVQIQVVPYLFSPGPEALLSAVNAPARLRAGEMFDLEVTVQATRAMRAGARVLAPGEGGGEEVIYEDTRDLNPGRNAFIIPLKAGAPGFASFRVQLAPEEDTFYQNNELAAFSQIAGPPKVLLVAPPAGEALGFDQGPRPDEYSALLAALQASGMAVEAVRPSALPSELPLLAGYAGVVLVDVPARDLSRAQMESLQRYVRDLGGGLVAVGGPTSFGVGGYFRTPLEETLPVEMQIKDQQRRPRLTIVFVIDRSGSMSEGSGGVSKVDLAKEAAMRSVELLRPGDRAGVVAFDESAAWVVPITEVSDPDPIIARIGSIRAGGGTDIMAGVQAVAKALPDDDAQLKHVVLLTDGGADPTGIAALAGRLHDEVGITLSTVAVGSDAAPWLPTLAQAGAGRHHFAADPASIPGIFTEETTLATRSYLIEEPFFPQQAAPSAMLAGVEAVPQLLGYVGTSIKPAATEVLRSAQGDPILATWQYGLGRAVAWTSDASGRWAQNWLAWPGFPRFWAQVVRSALSEGLSSPAETWVEARGERAAVVVNAVGPGGEFLNGYELRASVVSPAGEATAVELRQTAPGRYEGDFPPVGDLWRPVAPGAYLIRVSGAGAAGGESIGQTAGWVLSYSPEYRMLEPDPAALLRVAAATGGGAATADPARIFAHDLPAPRTTRPVWRWTLLAAALLLPLDIAVRRLAPSALPDLWRRARKALRRRPAGQAPERSPRLSALLAARERAAGTTAPPHAAPAGGAVPLPTAGAAGAPTAGPAAPQGAASAAGPAPDSPAEWPQPGGAPEGTAAALLAAKRARRKPES